MASEYIRCPHCGNRVQKTPLFQVLGEIGGEAGGPATEPCIACRRPINRQKIADGSYDEKTDSGCLGYLCFVVIVLLFCRFCH